jgi:hypothetical protein
MFNAYVSFNNENSYQAFKDVITPILDAIPYIRKVIGDR